MATLPYTRVVNVTLTRQDAFPTRTGFGTPLIFTTLPSDNSANLAAGAVKAYGSIAEVAVDYTTASKPYVMANKAFSQNPRPIQVKIGVAGAAIATAADIVTNLDALVAVDDNWYFLLPEDNAAWHDLPAVAIGFGTWTESKNKQCFIESNDVDTETAGGAAGSSIAKDVQDLGFSRTAVFYHDVAGTFLGVSAAAYMATRDFDQVNSSYTLKFKELAGIPVVDKGSAVIQAITGFVPALGLAATSGYYANTYINIGGRDFLTEGSNGNGGFVDEVHFQDWIIARTQEEILGLFTTNPKIPYTDKGFNQIVQSVQNVLGRALSAGNIAAYEDANGDIRNWSLSVPRVATVAPAQRRQRIAPAISAVFRYSGAVHYSTVNYTMQF